MTSMGITTRIHSIAQCTWSNKPVASTAISSDVGLKWPFCRQVPRLSKAKYSFNSLRSACGSWKISPFPEHSHAVPLVSWIRDTCVCVCVCSCLLCKPRSHHPSESPGMNREKGGCLYVAALSYFSSSCFRPFSEWASIAESAGNALVQYYYRQVLLLQMRGFVFRRHFLM